MTSRRLVYTDNADTQLTYGNYTYSINRYNNDTSNKPTGGTGVIISWSSSPTYGSQIAFNDIKIYFRTKQGSTISTWKTVAE